MLRPRRTASQKAAQKHESDNDSDVSDENDGDFSSASSDEYNPEETKTKESEDDEFITESESEESQSESSPEKNQQNTKSRGNRSIATLRGSVGNKFKRKQSGNLQEILQRAQFQKRKSIFDDTKDENTPTFDCSGGLRLSDSSDSEEETGNQGQKSRKKLKPSSSQVVSSTSTNVDLKAVYENYQQMEKAKAQLSSFKKSTNSSQKENLNIADLLAMGEGSSTSKSQKSRKVQEDSDDDGWEEVEDDAPTYQIPKQGVEIILNNGETNHKKQEKKVVDLEAQMKRKLNRNRKEYQVNLHKVNLLAWIAHGNFVNAKLNNTDLMAGALKLLPKNNNHCYPTDKTDVNYFEQVTNWFKSTIKLNNKNMYCKMKKRPPLMKSLALQLKFKTAICRRDYVLLYVIVLRALGIQCRMVQSLNCVPIMPPKSDLLSLAKKPEEKAKSSSSRSKKKSVKIPQLDGGNDLPRKKELKIKALPGYKVDESFVDLNQEKPKRKSVGEPSKRSSRGNQSPKPSTSVKIALDSPNRFKSPSEKLFKSASASKKGEGSKRKENGDKNVDAGKEVTRNRSKSSTSSSSPTKKSKETLQVFSPRRLRSRSRSTEPNQNGERQSRSTQSSGGTKKLKEDKSKEVSKTPDNKKSPPKSQESSRKSSRSAKAQETKPKDTLQVFSPRRFRSRSRSNEAEASKSSANEASKPNLKNLKRPSTSKQEVEAPKKPKTSGMKRKNEASDSEGSMKCFKESAKKKKTTSFPKTIDRRVVSTDDEEETTAKTPKKQSNSKKIDIWVEVYSEKDEKWLAIDVLNKKIGGIAEIRKAATNPMVYVMAWNNDNSVKDVSARYCENLNTTTRKQRVEASYLESIINQFAGQKTSRDVKEDDELNQLQLKIPMPTSIALFKNHPLYALKRHLLKYEAIYPPEPPILGYIREEAIYPRDCVFVLHTRETWLKEARVVKLNEVPYKMTKTLKWDNVTKKILKDVPQELFGMWQTKDFEPPTAENGIVPRNAYGNVELFKPCMLPKGTVHLVLPGLNKVCKKIGVDCSQAITGFDSNGGWPYPVYEGFVICEEFKEKVVDAWNREQEEIERKEQEKYEKRVYGNWKKLIKGLLIQKRLKNKYNFSGGDENKD